MPLHYILLLLAAAIFAAVPAQADYRQGVSITENFAPLIHDNGGCTAPLEAVIDGSIIASPGFCPVTHQTDYAITMNFDMAQTDYATRMVVWSNAGGIFNDKELRVFDLEIRYLNPSTLAPLTYTKTNVLIDDTTGPNAPVFHNFTDAGGNPINLYGIQTVKMSNLRNTAAATGTGEAAFREIQLDAFTNPAANDIRVTKSSAVYSGNTGIGPQFHLPQNDVMYTITVANNGLAATDSSSLFLMDPLPSQVTFFNGDANGAAAGTSVVIINNNGSGLTFPAGTVKYATTAPSGYIDCNYTPVSGYDPLARYICINPSGIMTGKSGAATPSFTVQFRVRIK